MLIVVDSLDESKTVDKSEFLQLISEKFSQLPKWIKIFITSRPELQVKEKLKDLNPLEILPDDFHQECDLHLFIQRCLPGINDLYFSLLKKCEGSFLYAYFLVNEVKKLGIEENVDTYVPQGISGFYEKQFKRLKTELQCYEQETEVSIFKTFVNVVAASDKPLPFGIIFTCMDSPILEFEIRKTIQGIMSEILPVYNDCLTVFHKSLWDWLKLEGYEEHAYAANVADGEKRLWRACKKVYTEINSLSSVSDFKLSPERRYAFESGYKYLVKIDDVQDFQWLVNVKINFLMIKYGFLSCLYLLYDKPFNILQEYKSKLPDPVYRCLSQLHTLLPLMNDSIRKVNNENLYLQCFANKQFDFFSNATACMKDVREILNEKRMIWLENLTNETDACFKIISCAFYEPSKDCGETSTVSKRFDSISSSPDNKLVACKHEEHVVVYELPTLAVIFRLQAPISFVRYYSQCIVFSPDSSYFLLNSLQTCVSIREKREVSFIPHGPGEIFCCSFSSCGTKLVTVEKQLIKMWDIKRKELLAQSEHEFDRWRTRCARINESYIFILQGTFSSLEVFDSSTLDKLKVKKIPACFTTYDNCIQLICPPFSQIDPSGTFGIKQYYQFATGDNILCATKYCSKPFVWNDRKCVMTSNDGLSLIVYDYIHREVVDTFQISCLPSYKSVDYIAHLGENKFLVCFGRFFLLVLSLGNSSQCFAFSFINQREYPTFCALSPDNLYVACSYGSPVLKIMNVDTGKTLQTVVPRQKPIACWLSELYLWVICEGLVVLKYPYSSTKAQIVGNYVEECFIDCEGWQLLKFAEGVLVTLVDKKNLISKICDEILCPQQFLESRFDSFCSVAISSDGCAVLLYDHEISYDQVLSRDLDVSYYEFFKMGGEENWELRFT